MFYLVLYNLVDFLPIIRYKFCKTIPIWKGEDCCLFINKNKILVRSKRVKPLLKKEDISTAKKLFEASNAQSILINTYKTKDLKEISFSFKKKVDVSSIHDKISYVFNEVLKEKNKVL